MEPDEVHEPPYAVSKCCGVELWSNDDDEISICSKCHMMYDADNNEIGYCRDEYDEDR